MTTLVNLSDVPVLERQHARAGLFRSQALLQGVEDTPENFFMQLSYTYADFESPRHRHNFDQVRVQLMGDADFARDGVMRPGMVGYFPEGVFYGPQSIAGESATLVLQFGGASGSGYISEERFQQGVQELKAFGSFEGGIFRRHRELEGRRNQDAYEAVWEHLHGRRLEYPKSSYPQPVFVDPGSLTWEAVDGAAGVRRKVLGNFSPRGVRLTLWQLDPGARWTLAPQAIGFVMSGRGRLGEQAWEARSSIRTTDEGAAMQAQATSEVLEIVLPRLG